MPSKWLNVQAGEELNKEIAMRLGYQQTWDTVREIAEKRLYDDCLPPLPKTFWRVFDADNEEHYYVGLKEWSTHAGIALSLVEDWHGFDLYIDKTANNGRWWATFNKFSVAPVQMASAETPALAICRLWLSYYLPVTE